MWAWSSSTGVCVGQYRVSLTTAAIQSKQKKVEMPKKTLQQDRRVNAVSVYMRHPTLGRLELWIAYLPTIPINTILISIENARQNRFTETRSASRARCPQKTLSSPPSPTIR